MNCLLMQAELLATSLGIRNQVFSRKINESGVYAIFSPSGNFYIGSSTNLTARLSKHRSELRKGSHENSALQRAANKYGVDRLMFYPVFLCSKDEIREAELLAIQHFTPEYNLTESVDDFLSDKWKDPDFRKRASERCRMQNKAWRSDETWIRKQKEGASRAMKRMMNDKDHIAKHIANVSIPNLSRINASKELKEKAAQARRERMAKDKSNPDAWSKRFEKQRRNSKPVMCLETGMVFKCVYDANSWLASLGLKASKNIYRAAISGGKASGYSWKFIDSLSGGCENGC